MSKFKVGDTVVRADYNNDDNDVDAVCGEIYVVSGVNLYPTNPALMKVEGLDNVYNETYFQLYEEPKDEIEIMSAADARAASKSAISEHDRKVIQEINKKIAYAITECKHNIYIYARLSDNVKTKLQNLGYTVKYSHDMNEAMTNISW
jgi:predicted NUDIX family phosphoesterase